MKKKCVLCLLALVIGFAFLLQNCQKEDLIIPENEGVIINNSVLPKGGVLVCHKGGIEIAIGEAAVDTHIAHGDAVDRDGDGFYDRDNPCSAIDCDDMNALINPDAVEITYDGIDNDCNPETLDDDLDLDGYNNDVDCNDNDALINPATEEVCDNSIDDNCNGEIDEGCAQIGDLREGGVVFYIAPEPVDLDNDGDLDIGLVSAFSDYEGTLAWANCLIDLQNVPNVPWTPYIHTGFGAEIGNGMNNTNNILNDCSDAPAALAARSYGLDWFLPSINELKEMFTNKSILEAVPGFTPFSNQYWSSTEESRLKAYEQGFVSNPGWQGVGYKNGLYNYVRAIRAF